MRLDLLILAPEVPYPPRKGTAMRNYSIVRYLGERHRVRLVTFGGHGLEPAYLEQSGACEKVYVMEPPRRSLRNRLADLAVSAPDLARRLYSPAMVAELRRILESDPPDIVQIEALEMAEIWRDAQAGLRGLRPLAVMDEHNAEFTLQKRAFLTDIRRPSRWVAAAYSAIQTLKLRQYERELLRTVDAVAAVSPEDAAALSKLGAIETPAVVPNGVDTDYFSPTEASKSRAVSTATRAEAEGGDGSECPTLVFTATLDYRPNVDAAMWMSREILPLVRNQCPSVRLYLVGRHPSPAVRDLGKLPGVQVFGDVDDVRPFIASGTVFVVPMRYGGGSRLKVLEAMAMGRALVSTTMGMDGISFEAGRHAIVADGARGFADAVTSLLGDEQRRRRMGIAARQLACGTYDWRRIVPRLEELHANAMRRASRQPRYESRQGG